MARFVNIFDAFISYAREDAEWVRRLADGLAAANFSIFLGEYSIDYGSNVTQVICEAMEKSISLIFVLSPDSISSKWVTFETSLDSQRVFVDQDKKLVPVVYRECTLPPQLRGLKRIDFSKGNYTQAFRELESALERHDRVTIGPLKVYRIENVDRWSEVLAATISFYYSYSRERMGSLQLVCNELLSNALLHPGVERKEASLTCVFDASEISLKIADRGRGFDLLGSLEEAGVEIREDPTVARRRGLYLAYLNCDHLSNTAGANGHEVLAVIKSKMLMAHQAQQVEEACFSVVKYHDGVVLCIVADVARLTIGKEKLLGDLIRRVLLTRNGLRHVILDLSDVSLIDSSGMGELTFIQGLLSEERVALSLVVPLVSKVREALRVTQLLSAFGEIFSDRDAALASLEWIKGGSPPRDGSV